MERREFSDVPTIMPTARSEGAHKDMGVDSGAHENGTNT